MNVGDLVEIDEDLFNQMVGVGVKLKRVALITKEDDGFYCVTSGEVFDLWLSPPDIKKIRLDKTK